MWDCTCFLWQHELESFSIPQMRKIQALVCVYIYVYSLKQFTLKNNGWSAFSDAVAKHRPCEIFAISPVCWAVLFHPCAGLEFAVLTICSSNDLHHTIYLSVVHCFIVFDFCFTVMTHLHFLYFQVNKPSTLIMNKLQSVFNPSNVLNLVYICGAACLP